MMPNVLTITKVQIEQPYAHSNTVNSLIATTSRKRPPPVSDHFVNKRFVSQLNTVSRALL